MKIEVNYVGRVEGHAHIKVDASNGEILESKIDIVETPRFFESFLIGKKWDEVQIIVSRVCGICSIAHSFASLKATEKAFGVRITYETEALRKVLLNAELIQSHILHICFLALPDFLGEGSVIPVAEKNPDIVKLALKLKRGANEVCDLIGGRTTHPVNLAVGGFNTFSKEALVRSKEIFLELSDDMDRLVEFFSGVKYPEFKRLTNSIALKKPGEYAFYDGVIKTPYEEYDSKDYLDCIKECVVSHSTAKHALYKNLPYRVGSLARYELNKENLFKQAKEVARLFSLDENIYNPYFYTPAQIVEVVHVIHESIELIDEILKMENPCFRSDVTPRAGRGVGIVEAPRGILIHDYTYNEAGRIEKANLIIPTAQNLANIEADIKKLLPAIIRRNKEEITQMLEMLLRAYDPCISCATHLVSVEFK